MAKAGPRKAAKLAGLKTYMPERSCSRGHLSERYVSDTSCLACNAEDRVSETGKAASKARAAAWYQANKDRSLEKTKRWRELNPEKEREITKKSQYKNRVINLQKQRDKRSANRELENFRMREWRSNNRERHLAYKNELEQLYRAKRGATVGWFIAADLHKILERQKFKCVYCPAEVRDIFHFDHRVAFSIVGGGNPENIQCLCADCNFRKGKKSHEEFAALKAKEQQIG